MASFILETFMKRITIEPNSRWVLKDKYMDAPLPHVVEVEAVTPSIIQIKGEPIRMVVDCFHEFYEKLPDVAPAKVRTRVPLKKVEPVDPALEPKSAMNTQVDGDHYLKLKVQPLAFAMLNDSSAVYTKIQKYVTRQKGDRKVNLEKAIHVCMMAEEAGFKEHSKFTAITPLAFCVLNGIEGPIKEALLLAARSHYKAAAAAIKRAI